MSVCFRWGAWALACLGIMLGATGPVAAAAEAEPFGLFATMLPEGPLPAKWREVERAVEAERTALAACRSDPDACTAPARQFLAIVALAAAHDGRARLGQINRAVNLAIRPVSDRAQHGVDDRWSAPLATLATGAGDCEDYAIAKLVALREAGIAAEDLRLVILRESASGEDHAVAAARVDGRWLILDNRTLAMVEDGALVRYRPLFTLDAGGARRLEARPVLVAAVSADAPVTASIAPEPVADDIRQIQPM
jgi:predicted transglutaminase-like cysteine proteinase